MRSWKRGVVGTRSTPHGVAPTAGCWPSPLPRCDVSTSGSIGCRTPRTNLPRRKTCLSVSPQSNASPCDGNATRIYLDRTSSDTITVTVTVTTYQRDSDITEVCPAILVLSGPKYGLAPYPIAGQKLVTAGSDVALQHVDLADFRAPRYLPGGYDLGSSFGLASARGSGRPPGSQVRRVLSAHQQPATKDITLTWQDPAVDSTAAPRPSMKSQVIACATRVLRSDLAVTACSNTVDPQQPVSVAELQRVVDSIPN